MTIKEILQFALERHQTGNFKQAEQSYKKVLKKQPNNFDALHMLGVLCSQIGHHNAAIQYIEKALKFNTNSYFANFNLGKVFSDLKKYDKAIEYYQKAVQLKTDYSDAYYSLGNAYENIGQLQKAIDSYQNVLVIDPYNVYANYNIGSILLNRGHLDKAILYFRKAVQLNPNFAEAYNNLGRVLQQKGQFDESIDNYKKAININPKYASAYINLGSAINDKGKSDEAMTVFDKAILIDPYNFRARFAKCILQLPIIYSEYSHIQICRDHYFDELIKLQDSFSSDDLENINSAADAIGSQQPFYLAYQGLNDRELQHSYGNLICRVMALKYPRFANRPIMPSYLYGEPLRIGFVSGFFYLHSNWKIPIKGWIENIDKNRFDLYGYYTGKIKDEATEDAKLSFTRFIDDIYSFEELCKAIRKDNLHVLIYPEVGMDPMTVKLAALRLAPIQCTSWGHPETSGFPTIDYFLSSDLMEPDDADDHYTEKLIRLPNLSIYYTPLDFPPADINRETFGIRQKSVLYLCCQSLFKYLPQYDEIYPRIAKEVGDCQFLFISHKSNYVTEQSRQRIYQAFEKFGLRADNYIVFLPRLDIGQYNEINSLSDIYLDSIGWSGCNSTFEAISYDLPIVTLPGELMRGRHSAAILRMMGMQETIVSSLDKYVETAVRLGVDSEWRKQISEKIANNKQHIYRDMKCITALEHFLERAVKEREVSWGYL
jgi:protein O-GlcNAc transferase